jgi:hypothetical protein
MIRHRDATIIMMRTTVNLPDDVYELARERAHRRRISLGEALSELVRNGADLETSARKPLGIRFENGFPVFDVPPDAPKLTSEDVRRMQDHLDEEDAHGAWNSER